MVNLWPGIPTNCLCDRHLNAACNESTGLLRYHMLKNHKIDGWIKNGCIDLDTLEARIKELLDEAKTRGKNWKYVLTEDFDDAIFWYQALAATNQQKVRDVEAIRNNPAKLGARCNECRKRMEENGVLKKEILGDKS